LRGSFATAAEGICHAGFFLQFPHHALCMRDQARDCLDAARTYAGPSVLQSEALTSSARYADTSRQAFSITVSSGCWFLRA
jgi:hypothetical protein